MIFYKYQGDCENFYKFSRFAALKCQKVLEKIPKRVYHNNRTLCHIKWLIFDIFYLDQLGFVGEDVTETPVTGAVRTFLKEGSDTSKNFSGKGWC